MKIFVYVELTILRYVTFYKRKSESVKMQVLLCNCRNTTILSVTVTWLTFQSSISFVTVIFLIMPKARRSSYTMAFRIKVVAEAEAVENSSEIAWDYGLSESMVRRWRRDYHSKRVIRRSDMSENACRTFQGSKSVIWYLLRCLKL